MATVAWNKSRRLSTDQSSPRAAGRKTKNAFFGSTSPTSSSSPSPPRRRDALRNLVINAVRPPRTEAGTEYRGVRYREELNKYVTEIRPARSSKKIWLGTYDTAEVAARAFDIGNLCCKKNLPLNFPDSPRMLKRISSQLSPDEARSAIAKLAKEVARVVINSTSDGETIKRKEVDRAAALKAHELVQIKAEEPLPKPEFQALHLESATSVVTYTEQLNENILEFYEEEIATPMALTEGGSGGHSCSFDLSQVFLNDDLAGIPCLGMDFGTIQDSNGEIYYYAK